jgi:L-asparaginase
VIFTGSQLPIGDLRTDAKENLITSIHLASLKKNGVSCIQEVGLYFEYKLYRGNRTTKVNADHFEAFDSPNYPQLAESGVQLKINERSCLGQIRKRDFKMHKTFSDRRWHLKDVPGDFTIYICKECCASKLLKGLIIETYGAGNATTEPWFISLLKRAIKVVFMLLMSPSALEVA